MIKKFTPYIYILFFAFSFHGIFGQEITLNITSKDSTEVTVLHQLNFKKKLPNKEAVFSELNSIENQIQQLGYFTYTREAIEENENSFTVTYSLGFKTETIYIALPEKIRRLHRKFSIYSKDTISLAPSEVASFIQSTLRRLDKKGESFTEIQLTRPKAYKNSILFTLISTESRKRKIDNIVVKGYDDFPNAFIEKYFKLKKSNTFSKSKLEEISSLTKSLDFVEEIKPPEVLFKQDSTVLYLFLKRLKTSTIDGIVNFASEDDGSGLLINGNLDLKLNNILNSGEQFELYWNRVKDENSEFRIGTSVPYVFNSSFSSNINFNIYRQDSTFLNTTLNIALDYQLNPKSKVFITYSSENSEHLLNATDNNLDSYSNSFWGLGYQYSISNDNPLFNPVFTTEIRPAYGRRKNSGSINSQFRVRFSAEGNFQISSRSYLNVRNQTGILESDRFLTNELFRIGGANSIRGFNEQSIFTNRYSFINVEYRYATSLRSYLHSISDLGFFKNTTRNRTDSLLGLGAGYLFTVNNNRVNLGYVVGIRSGGDFDLNNSQVIIKWTSSF